MTQKKKVGANELSNESLGGVSGGVLQSWLDVDLSPVRYYVHDNNNHYGSYKKETEANKRVDELKKQGINAWIARVD